VGRSGRLYGQGTNAAVSSAEKRKEGRKGSEEMPIKLRSYLPTKKRKRRTPTTLRFGTLETRFLREGRLKEKRR